MRAPTLGTGLVLSLLVACGSAPVPRPPEPPPPEPPAAGPAEPDAPRELAGPDCLEPRQTDAEACAIELDSPKESSSSEP